MKRYVALLVAIAALAVGIAADATSGRVTAVNRYNPSAPLSSYPLTLQLRADLGLPGGTVDGAQFASWTDQSVTASVWSQGTGANQPTYRATGGPNNGPYIDFGVAAATTFLQTASSQFTGQTGIDMFFVYRTIAIPPTSPGTPGIGDLATDQTGDFLPYNDGNIYLAFGSTTRHTVTGGMSAIPANVWCVLRVTSTSSEWTMQVNGRTIFTTATNTFGIAGQGGTTIYFGKEPGGQHFKGGLASMIFFSAKLNASQYQGFKQYIYTAHGLTMQ